GSDPLTQTVRGKLQNQRQKLNEKINKELRMRAGAENLYRAAANNRKLRDRVGLELSYFNSNIQLLKEQLSDMNSSVEVYQHENSENTSPLLPLGLKETIPVNLSVAFKDAILEHYSEDGEKYTAEIKELCDLREAVRTPERSHAGVELLMEYFNQLSYVEKRFFSAKRALPIYFQWFDCLSGVPDTQKSVGFEKGSIIFNIGALYTQIACKQDRTTKEGIVQCIVNFEKAAGSFRYLIERFSSSPCQDMQHNTLSMLVSLMLAQAQECVLEGRLIGGNKDGIVNSTKIAQECAMVSLKYGETHKMMSEEPIKSYLPFTWLTMIEAKHHFFKALAHYYVTLALLDGKESTDSGDVKETVEASYAEVVQRDENNSVRLPNTAEERKHLGKAHLRESIVNHEESIRIHGLCKQLRKIDPFKDILEKTHERAVSRFSTLEEEDDFSDLLTVPDIIAKSEHNTTPVVSDLSKVKVTDIFWKLGPIKVFNAANDWSAPRTVVLDRQPTEGFGFSVRGDAPVVIADVEDNSVAMRSGMKVDDYIVGIGSVDTKWAKHDQVVKLVKQANLSLTLVLVTPVPRSDTASSTPTSTLSLPRAPFEADPHNQNTPTLERNKKNQNRTSAPWMFMRRSSSKDKNGAPNRPVSMYSLPATNGSAKFASNGEVKTNPLSNGDVEL
ncbi:unnamed protein product, partial [Candidula unifasciata]